MLCANWPIIRLDRACLYVHDLLRVLGLRWDFLEWHFRFCPEITHDSAIRGFERLSRDLREMGIQYTLVDEKHGGGRSSILLDRGTVTHIRETLGYDYDSL